MGLPDCSGNEPARPDFPLSGSRRIRRRPMAGRCTAWLIAVAVAAACGASCSGTNPVRPGVSTFQWTVSPSTEGLTLQPGATGAFRIRIDSKVNINSEVSLSLSGSVPSNSTWTFAPQRLASTTRDAELVVQTTSQTPVGSYPLTITASEVGQGASVLSIRLDVVSPGEGPDFTLELDPADITLTSNASGPTVAFRVRPINGFTGT